MRCSSALAVLALAASLVAAAPARAQVIGARGGINLPTIAFDDPNLFEVKANPGWVAGGFVTFLPAARLSVQVEGLVSRRLVTLDTLIDDAMTYVEIPVMLRVGLYRRARLTVHALAGASANVLIAASESFNGNSAGDIRPTLEPWEIAAVVGADARIKDRWVVGFRYLYGLTQVYRASAEFPARQQGYEITFGYQIR